MHTLDSRRGLVLGAFLLIALLVPLSAAGSGTLDAQAIYQRAVGSIGIIRVQGNGGTGLGTGFLVDRGLVLTASHVARTAESITVDFGDNQVSDARLVGYDARRDVAALRLSSLVSATPLDVVETDAVQTGDPVVVIGTPRGRPRVMTTGEVRAMNVTFPGLLPKIMIFFDAAVAPGNSGGPLLNAQGQVIGVVVAGTARGDGGGLAVSGTTVKSTLPGIVGGARVERAWMGITGTSVTADLARQRRLSVDRGILVLEVLPGGPAETAGLRGAVSEAPPGDVIISINSDPVDDWDDLLDYLAAREPGQRLRLGIVRGTERYAVTITLGARP